MLFEIVALIAISSMTVIGVVIVLDWIADFFYK